MYQIKEKYVNEIVINKSRFIGVLLPLSDESEVKLLLKDLNKEYPKATHYCYAYKINGKEKSSDDGEPSGTAGRPMLEFLNNVHLENVLVVAIRYFGGIKLGAGGLLRAYVDTAKCVYDIAIKYEVVTYNSYDIEIDYKYFDSVRLYLSKDGIIDKIDYEEKIIIHYSNISLDINELKDITNGDIKIEEHGTKIVFKKVG
jgi:uncharacterized YigZ family protein